MAATNYVNTVVINRAYIQAQTTMLFPYVDVEEVYHATFFNRTPVLEPSLAKHGEEILLSSWISRNFRQGLNGWIDDTE